ncbi:hypothetical protein MAL1_00237 [Bacteriophage DSS3_MAL1]|nr:hypothetical protein MAL1_00237 [Bacteriophage DSS3_MAL1]
MIKPAPIRIWRDPTRRDVEELCRELGGELFVRPAYDGHRLGAGARAFYKRSVVDGVTVNMWIGYAREGQRPDWRDMLKRLGSDWA